MLPWPDNGWAPLVELARRWPRGPRRRRKAERPLWAIIAQPAGTMVATPPHFMRSLFHAQDDAGTPARQTSTPIRIGSAQLPAEVRLWRY